jgi:YXWGXW repeat-containing protein
MNRRNALLGLLAFAGLGMPILGEAAKVIVVDVAPPPPREEVVVTRTGYVWVPGYWRWDGHRHVWVKGHYVPERHGYHWSPHRWEEHDKHWRFEAGHWDRD